MQNLWYSQSLMHLAWLDSGEAVETDQFREDIHGTQYFTDGYRLLMWLSGDPFSMLEMQTQQWDKPPGLRAK